MYWLDPEHSMERAGERKRQGKEGSGVEGIGIGRRMWKEGEVLKTNRRTTLRLTFWLSVNFAQAAFNLMQLCHKLC